MSPPAYRDLAGLGGIKRSVAVAQLEASNSCNSLCALAEASAEHKMDRIKPGSNVSGKDESGTNRGENDSHAKGDHESKHGLESLQGDLSPNRDTEANKRTGVNGSSRKRNRTDSIVEFQNKIGRPLGQASLRTGHSSSIQNFFLLVENGDIPQPEENVLAEPLMKHKQPGPVDNRQMGVASTAAHRTDVPSSSAATREVPDGLIILPAAKKQQYIDS